MADVPLTVIGAGVVGLAVAARLAPRHPDLVILERHPRHGQETSSRNSEVIHAGMYYAPGSLKAQLCVEGNRLTYEACARHHVPHRRLTKLIVAVSEPEIAALEAILARGKANGVEMWMITGAEAREMEPAVPAVAALFSPTTGVVSAHDLMDAYLEEARAHGAILQTRSELLGAARRGDGYELTVRTGNDTDTFTSERVVNAAGLECDRVAALFGIDVDAAGYRMHWCKGSYFAVVPAKAGIVSRLVYPVPTAHSLGVHALLDVAGRLRFGPDAEYIPRVQDYAVGEEKRARFAEAVRRLVPALRDEDLTPDISGIRPKTQAPGDPVRDFVVAEESARGLPGLVNLVGIESPGLTAAPAIARAVERALVR